MNENNYKYPDVTGEIRGYWLEGQTGGQLLVGNDGHYNRGYYEENKDIIHSIMGANAWIHYEINLS